MGCDALVVWVFPRMWNLRPYEASQRMIQTTTAIILTLPSLSGHQP